MRNAISRCAGLVCAGLLVCVAAGAQQAAISGVNMEGTVIDAVSRKPLAGVHVSLTGTHSNPDEAYGAISDASGHYSIGNIRPGTYGFSAKRAAYVYIAEKEASATPTLTLKSGGNYAGFDIPMTPEASISGRVVDEFGDPVEAVTVRAVSAGTPPYGAWLMRTETDDRGEYRISGIPGQYYIEASVHPLESSGPAEIRSDGSPAGPYATIFYPGALARERGKVVEAMAGREAAGIDIHVAHEKSLRISGVVTGLPVTPGTGAAARATVDIDVAYKGQEAGDDTLAAEDGHYEFTKLAPAEYTLRAIYPPLTAGGDGMESPPVKVTLETDDAVVNLPLLPMGKISGELVVRGAKTGQTPDEKWTVRLNGEEGSRTTDAPVAPDGTFTVARIAPDIYRVNMDPLPGNAYIERVDLGNAEAPDGKLDFTRGAPDATLRVTVNRDGGEIQGLAMDSNGEQALGRRLLVFLAPDVNEFSTWMTAPSLDATFQFHGIRPGKYRLFVVDPVEFGARSGNQSVGYDALKAVAAQAAQVEIRAADHLTRNLPLAAKDGAHAN